jgi:phospholipase/carboxylesterase
VAPDSTGSTWDIAYGGFGADVKYIDRVLKDVFPKVAVDPARIAIAGFSDGASYALSLGLTNGDLFTRVAAFSPGFFLPGGLVGKPPVYISHGTGDTILPINSTSRRLVPQLTRAGYAVKYHEFDGPHTVPPGIAQEGIEWIASDV